MGRVDKFARERSVKAPIESPAPAAQNGIVPSKVDEYHRADTALGLRDDTVSFDSADGVIYASSLRFKSEFRSSGATFIPYFGADAPRNEPVGFTLRSARVGEFELGLKNDPPVRADRTVTIPHGSLREVYHLTSLGLEQTFVFDELPSTGDVVVEIAVATDLRGGRDGRGLAFVGARGRVTYGAATAVDARGHSLPLETEFDGTALRIRVPADFVGKAALPLVIDPLIGVEIQFGSGNVFGTPDIAYDVTYDQYMAVYDRVFSLTDIDCYAVRCDASMNPLSTTTVDSSSDCWALPKIATNNLADVYLVVSQYSADHVSPFWIRGRLITALGAAQTAFDIERAGLTGHASGDKINPDVGGDPELTGPTYFTVVWERVFSPSDHDVHMKQVRVDGSLRTDVPVMIDNSIDFDSVPSISKSNGHAPYPTQYWGVVWQHRFSASDEDSYGCFVRWDGVLQNNNGSNYAINTSSLNSYFPTISSPLDEVAGQRWFLVCDEFVSGGQSDVSGTPVQLSGITSANYNLQTLEGGGVWAPWGQFRPSVDSDGCRFTVGYHEQFLGTGSDYDTYMSAFAYDVSSGAFTCHDPRNAAGYRSSGEVAISLTSTRSGGGRAGRYAGVWIDRGPPTSAQGQIYDGITVGGGFALRPTGCGAAATIGYYGDPFPGGQIVIYQLLGTGPRGYFVGLPASNPIGICPGCTLGVQGDTIGVDPYVLDVPCIVSLAGATFSFQGFNATSGPCLGSISLSDTLDITLR